MHDALTLKLKIEGTFPDDTFIDWIIARATVLDLAGWVNYQNATRIELQASGERVLVEALEVACSLGPVNAQVDSITRREFATPAMFYRQQRRFIRYSPEQR